MSDVRGRDRLMTRLTITGRLQILEDAREHYDADRRIEADALWESARAHYGTSLAGCPGYAEAAQAREQAKAREERRRRGDPTDDGVFRREFMGRYVDLDNEDP